MKRTRALARSVERRRAGVRRALSLQMLCKLLERFPDVAKTLKCSNFIGPEGLPGPLEGPNVPLIGHDVAVCR
jgi:hypothetical protein